MPLDPVSLESTIEFVAGSQHAPALYRPRKFATSNNYPLVEDATDEQYEDVPDIENDRDKYKIIKWAVEPGDVIVFHMKCLHGAPENLQPIQRRVLSTRWLGDDCVIAKRPWVTSPPTNGGLKPGDKAMCEEFPRIWSKSNQR
ncbi:hypothetical protein EB796_006992 [Bugula neritina]|uniref:Phytanoyl-CoA dioxygenase n=1 Tax=Bugula neritina TaxID=10212 RepID=A0A7J7KA25_BUGNE|nr:hypothetical protein EB796_006992 [Bugula neritina]